jgi:hypothetical protein
VTIGGSQYRGNDDYLRTINNIFNKIANLSVSNGGYKTLLWDLDFSTNCLINSIIDPEARNTMERAKETILQIEYVKRLPDGTVYNTLADVMDKLKEDEIARAGIAACMTMVGYCRTYFDRYFGFETKLEVMQ